MRRQTPPRCLASRISPGQRCPWPFPPTSSRHPAGDGRPHGRRNARLLGIPCCRHCREQLTTPGHHPSSVVLRYPTPSPVCWSRRRSLRGSCLHLRQKSQICNTLPHLAPTAANAILFRRQLCIPPSSDLNLPLPQVVPIQIQLRIASTHPFAWVFSEGRRQPRGG